MGGASRRRLHGSNPLPDQEFGESPLKRELIPLVLSLSLIACGRDEANTAPQLQSSAVQEVVVAAVPGETSAAPTEDLVVLDAHGAAMGDVALARTSEKITGKVEEILEGAEFKYLRIATAEGDVWTAVRQTAVRKGDRITVIATMNATDFESKALGRRFDRLIFGNVEGAAPTIGPAVTAAAAPAAPQAKAPEPAKADAMTGAFPPAMMEAIARRDAGGERPAEIPPAMKEALARGGSPHGAKAAKSAIDLASIRVDRSTAPDGKSVQEIWGSRTALKDKSVTVRGKVVKYLPGIMGRNWVHLRDGSGSDQKGDNDITLTTNEALTVGDVVEITGTVRVDKDFGSGYRYAVIIEEARIK